MTISSVYAQLFATIIHSFEAAIVHVVLYNFKWQKIWKGKAKVSSFTFSVRPRTLDTVACIHYTPYDIYNQTYIYKT